MLYDCAGVRGCVRLNGVCVLWMWVAYGCEASAACVNDGCEYVCVSVC